MYTVEIFFTHFAIWVKISPLGGGAHKISVEKQVRTAAQGLVLIFAKVATYLMSLQPTEHDCNLNTQFATYPNFVSKVE